MYRFYIKGIVQGVGFRPYIKNACSANQLQGYVQNTGEGVVIAVDNKEKLVAILKDVPVLARIDSYDVQETDEDTPSGFEIRNSSGSGFAEIPPDLFLCENCRAELQDKKDRRYGYFFITCTNCGPRFSIARKSPYDRKNTTMDDFPMCDACRKEYTDPKSRRYHAQTIACPTCGPQLTFSVEGKEQQGDSLELAANALSEHQLVALKEVGGFHLACTLHPPSLEELRKAKGRTDKPYAIMCR
jgi:hydrogenase maturation protein HypF